MNAEAPENVVGVHIGDPKLALWLVFAPPGNNVGFLLLHRLLELALLREGLTLEECCGACGGELNDCIFLAAVTDPARAIETIKGELASLALLPFCQIGIMEDPGWRCVYPSAGVRMGWLMDNERLEHAMSQFVQAESAQFDSICTAVRRFMRKPGQEGDKQ